MDDVVLIKECFTNLWTIHLTIISISLSIITLLYSFILSKRDALKLFTEQMKLGNTTPVLSQQKDFAIKYIKHLKNINKHCFIVLLSSILLAIFSWIGMRFLSTNIWCLLVDLRG